MDGDSFLAAEFLLKGGTMSTPLRECWSPGERAWFEYHCWEHPDSHDAPAWYRSHQRVTILAVDQNDSAGMTRAERDEAAMPYTYTARFSDGLEWCVFEDELSESRVVWCRPDPPLPAPV